MPPEPSEPSSMARLLRERTRAAHHSVDSAMSRFDLADPAHYGEFLSVHWRSLNRIAGQARAQDREDFERMLGCVEADLRALGHPVEAPAAQWPAGGPVPSQWGVAYVIRGSRLGALILRKRVPAGLPAAYLDCVPGLPWPQFVQQLDEAGNGFSAAQRTQALEGAQFAFGVFQAATTQPL